MIIRCKNNCFIAKNLKINNFFFISYLYFFKLIFYLKYFIKNYFKNNVIYL